MWYPNRDRRARTRRVATSLVNSVLRCSWYLVTRCLSEIRAAHERRESNSRATLTQSRCCERRAASRLVAAAPAYYAGLCSSLLRWCERPRFDSTRLNLSRTSEKSPPHGTADSDNPYIRSRTPRNRYLLSIFRHWHYSRWSGCGDRDRETPRSRISRLC